MVGQPFDNGGWPPHLRRETTEMRPGFVEYLNFRAILPPKLINGEKVAYGENEVRMCMGYAFLGGKYEARLTEHQARTAHNVLTTYYGCETEEVPDVSVPEADSPAPEKEETGGSKTETVDGASGASSTGQSASDSTKRGKSTKTKAGRGKRKTSKDNSKQRANPDQTGQSQPKDTQLGDDLV